MDDLTLSVIKLKDDNKILLKKVSEKKVEKVHTYMYQYRKIKAHP